MNDKQIFGAFLKSKRHEREIPVRVMAERIDMGVGQYCDFSPEALDVPGALDVDSFIEYYLRLSVEYRRICLDQKTPLAGHV